MAILIDEKTEVIVQGITGREGLIRTRCMREYGTKVVAGVTPGKGGTDAEGIPVYNTVKEALKHHSNIGLSAVLVPRGFAKNAALEALDAGVKVVVLITERVPHQDILEVIAKSKEVSAYLIGPNSPGIVSPGKANIGGLGGRAEFARDFFMEGPIGVVSRSGGTATTICYYLTRSGLGQSTAIGMGGDAYVGMNLCELLALFENDEETRAVAFYGEIGTTIEEDAADFIKKGGFTKPLVAYISGRYTRPEIRFGHAGAIITHGRGRAEDKIQALKDAGVRVVDHLAEIGGVLQEILLNGKNQRLKERGGD